MPRPSAPAAATEVAAKRLLNDHVHAYLAARDSPVRSIGELTALEQAQILRAALQGRPPAAHFTDLTRPLTKETA